ncbi:MAG: class I SAM-dependent methyltransferase, partial [Acidimicrobiia bacterium]|nr:class I SAM-dependent methyltransferase [Acidimicrobiia bacterium]
MVGHRAYDFMYRWWAPWDSAGVRDDLVALVESHPFPAGTRAIDLGCGTGANVVYLAQQGFEAVGADFSSVAIAKAHARARENGVGDQCRFLEMDLTVLPDPSLGTFDLLIDFGTLDDLDQSGRQAMARTVRTLAAPEAMFLLWAFYGPVSELPWFSLGGPSRLYPGLVPGEAESLFGDDFDLVSQRTGS